VQNADYINVICRDTTALLALASTKNKQNIRQENHQQ